MQSLEAELKVLAFTIWWSSIAAMLLTCASSLVWPNTSFDVYQGICNNAPTLCRHTSGYVDSDVLGRNGFVLYARGFSLLRFAGPYLLIFLTISSVFVSVATGGFRGLKASNLPIVLMLTFTCLYLSLVQDDFYFVGEGDFSRWLRPPMGSVLYVALIVISAFGISAIVAATYNVIVSKNGGGND